MNATLITRTLICLWAFGAAFVFAYAIAPFDLCRAFWDFLAPDGSADGYGLQTHEMIARHLLAAAVLLSAGLIWAVLSRRHLALAIANLPDDLSRFGAMVGISFKRTFLDLPRADLAAFALVVLVGLGLRLLLIDAPLDHDEAGSYVNHASKPIAQTLSNAAASWHMFLSVVVKASVAVFGNTNWSIRLPVFVFGMATLFLTYWMGAQLFSRPAALIGTAFAAIAFPLVEYSVNARGYALGNAFFLLAVGLAAIAVKKNNMAAWLLLVPASALSLYSVKSMVMGFFGLAIWMVLLSLSENGRRETLRLSTRFVCFGLLSAALTLFLYSPFWLMNGLDRLMFNNIVFEGPAPYPPVELATRILSAAYDDWFTFVPLPVQAAIVAGFLFGVFRNRRAAILVVAFLIGSAPIIVLIGGVRSPPRIWQFLLPLAAVISGLGMANAARLLISERRVRVMINIVAPLTTAALVATSVSQWQGRSQIAKPLYDLSLALQARMQAGDVVIGYTITPPVVTYMRRYFDKRGQRTPYLATHVSNLKALQVCHPTVCAYGKKLSGRVFVISNKPSDPPGQILAAAGWASAPATASLKEVAAMGKMKVYVAEGLKESAIKAP